MYLNYPNPFNPTTAIQYDLPADTKVILRIYDVLGEIVATLVDQVQSAGYKMVLWDAGNKASGMYFYRLQAGDFVAAKKLMVIK